MLAFLVFFAWVIVPTTRASDPSASSSEDVAGAADSLVEEVTTTAEEAVPDPPAVELPPVPAAPPAAPPEVSASPPPSPPEPEAATPDPVKNLSHSVSKVVGAAKGGAKAHPTIDAVTDGAKEAVGAVPEAAGAAPTAAAEADRPASGETRVGTGQGADQAPADQVQTAADPDSASVEATNFAPVSWFLAHVWPAIALESGGEPGAALSGITLPADGEPGAPPLAQIAGDLFQELKGSRPVSADLSLPLPAPAQAAHRSPTPPWESALSAGARIALYIGIAVLLALLAYMLRTELSSAPGRPGHR